MISPEIIDKILTTPLYTLIAMVLISFISLIIAHYVLARSLVSLALHTHTKIDDILVKNLQPFRIAWIAPLLVFYTLAYLQPDVQIILEQGSLFIILWLALITFNGLLNALNEIYERSPSYKGVSIQGYLDLVKLLSILVGIILSISIFTGESPLVFLTGLGALTAVLLLIFRDTILSIVASIQIAAHDLIKEGDWIEVPSYSADGDVVNISLHTVKIQNFDKTITVIPTYRLVEVAYRNWRGMQESGGRRIMRSISLDMQSIRFCTPEMIDKLRKIDLICNYLETRLQSIEKYQQQFKDVIDSPLDGPQITNSEIFRFYIESYLKTRPDIHQEKYPMLVRSLSPSSTGLPIEIYSFTKTTDWNQYETIQAEIFDHLLAAIPYFELRVFQQPTGLGFSNISRTNHS